MPWSVIAVDNCSARIEWEPSILTTLHECSCGTVFLNIVNTMGPYNVDTLWNEKRVLIIEIIEEVYISRIG